MRMRTKTFLRISTLTFALATLFSISACSDDDEPAFLPKLPTDGGNVVKSISRVGSIVTPTHDWEFSYNGPRLTDSKGTVRDPNTEIDKTCTFTTSIKYGEHNVYIKKSTGDDIKITLNGSHLIERMYIGRHIYDFQYKNGYICSWQKTIFESGFGATYYKSSATLEYYENGNNFDLKKIQYTGPDNVTVTTTFTPNQLRNLNGLLPEAVSKEIGFLDFEDLFYAGLLGKATTHLVKSLSVNNPKDSTQNYTLDFNYSVEGNNTTLCNYQTPSGKPVSVYYKY